MMKRKQRTMETPVFPLDSDSILKNIRNKVDDYFTSNGIKKTGNTSLYVKSVFMLSLWLVPFIVTWIFGMNTLVLALMAILTGLGMAGVGMNIMHDANHGTYSDKRWVNEFVANMMFLLPAHPLNWKIQHNLAHHTHTNIDGHDTDIESGKLFRFTKEQEWKPYHRFQAFYAVFLYSMTTLMRAIVWEFTRLAKYFREHRNISTSKKKKEWTTLISLRLVYFFFWIGIPILFGANEWYFALMFFLVMHLVCALLLTVVFQTAHVVPKAQTYGREEGKNSWAKHQLLTTCNFATNSSVANWLFGGLNLQKEHHLFPNISHVHYRKIVPIVREYCAQHQIPYLEYRTSWSAMWAHFELLNTLGKQPT